MDITQSIMSVMGNYVSYIVLLAIIVGLLIILYINISRRYPKVHFIVYEGKTQFEAVRRLMDDKIVPDSLIDILLHGQKIIGMNIRDFDYIINKNGKLTYLATMRGNELVPLKLNESSLDPAELGIGREIAIRYVNTIDATKMDLMHQNPLILSLIAVLPFAVVILLNGIIFYLAMNDMLPKVMDTYQEISKSNAEISKTNLEISENLAGVIRFLPAQYHNSTVYVTR